MLSLWFNRCFIITESRVFILLKRDRSNGTFAKSSKFLDLLLFLRWVLLVGVCQWLPSTHHSAKVLGRVSWISTKDMAAWPSLTGVPPQVWELSLSCLGCVKHHFPALFILRCSFIKHLGDLGMVWNYWLQSLMTCKCVGMAWSSFLMEPLSLLRRMSGSDEFLNKSPGQKKLFFCY